MQLGLLTIRSRDLIAAEQFYGQLGLSFESHVHGAGPEHLCCHSDRLAFEIYPLREGETPTSSARLGFRVNGLAECVAKIEALGGTILSPIRDSPWGRRAIVCDPDGHKVEVYEG